MMTEHLVPLGLGALAGAALGLAFYVGLWATVRRVAAHGPSRPLLAVSFAVRTALAAVTLTLLARQGVAYLLGAVVGFVATRPLVTRAVVGRRPAARPPDGRGGSGVGSGSGAQAPASGAGRESAP